MTKRDKMIPSSSYQKSIDIFLRINAIYQYVKNSKTNISSKEEIINYLVQNDFKLVSKKTVERDIQSLDTYFGIQIVKSRKLNKYIIKEEQEFNNKLYESMFSLNLIYEVKNEQLKSSLNMIPYLQMEHKEGIHTYGEEILKVLACIAQKSLMSVKYRSNSMGVLKTYSIAPYYIIENKNRFYILGRDNENNTFRTLAFDRINSIRQLDIAFEEPNYEAIDKLIQSNYGIYIFDEEPVDILLKVSANQIFYFKTLKMHHSQEIIEIEKDKQYEVCLKLIPNYEFEMQLLSMGAEIEVLKPQSLRDSIASKAKALFNIYNK